MTVTPAGSQASVPGLGPEFGLGAGRRGCRCRGRGRSWCRRRRWRDPGVGVTSGVGVGSIDGGGSSVAEGSADTEGLARRRPQALADQQGGTRFPAAPPRSGGAASHVGHPAGCRLWVASTSLQSWRGSTSALLIMLWARLAYQVRKTRPNNLEEPPEPARSAFVYRRRQSVPQQGAGVVLFWTSSITRPA